MKRPLPGGDSPLLGWMLVSGLVLWGAAAAWQAGLLQRLTSEDPSRISWVILAVYLVTQLYAGWLALGLHRDGRRIEALAGGGQDDAGDPLSRLLARRRAGADEDGELREFVGHRLASGWFIADLMFKLGLIGTVIGFIVMLGAITDLRSMDIHQAQRMLGDMSAGMRLALYTTLTGLGCGALTGIQFHLLERSAASLVRRIIDIADTPRPTP